MKIISIVTEQITENVFGEVFGELLQPEYNNFEPYYYTTIVYELNGEIREAGSKGETEYESTEFARENILSYLAILINKAIYANAEY